MQFERRAQKLLIGMSELFDEVVRISVDTNDGKLDMS